MRCAVLVLEDRRREPGLVAAGRMVVGLDIVEAVRGLHLAPAAVLALGDDVDLLVAVLLDVAAEQLVLAAHVEGAAPRVAVPVGPDPRVGVGVAGERIVLGDRAVGVDAQDLAVRAGQILAVALGHVVADAPVVGVAAVTGRDVELAVRPETDPMAVVVELRPVDGADDGLGVLVRPCSGRPRTPCTPRRHWYATTRTSSRGLPGSWCACCRRRRTCRWSRSPDGTRCRADPSRRSPPKDRRHGCGCRGTARPADCPWASMMRTRPHCSITNLRSSPFG